MATRRGNTMKNRQGVAVLLGVLALGPIFAMTSCGPSVDLTGGSNGGNTDGTGVGPVSGFGSVIVNGIRFDDRGIDNTNFIDAHGRTKADLKVGMVTRVTASSIDIAGGTGVATKIEVQRQADGPADDNAVSLDNNSVKVLGQTVFVDVATVFDNVTDLVAIDNLARSGKRPELEIHGVTDDNGAIRASFVHRWSDDRVPGREVQLKGTVTNLNTADNSLAIGIQRIVYTGFTAPAANDYVEVGGIYRTSDNAVVVNRPINKEDPAAGQSPGDINAVEGYIDNVISSSPTGGSFRVLGPNGSQIVNWATGSIAFRDGVASDIQTGAKVEVYGTRKPDSSLAATRISFREPSNILLVGQAFGKTATSFSIFGVKVTVNASTSFKDSAGSNPPKTFGILDLANRDTVKVTGFRDSSSLIPVIVATSVERIDPLSSPDRYILQGVVNTKTLASGQLDILGLVVQTLVPNTEFLRADGTPFPGSGVAQQVNFFNAVTEGVTVVKARGTAPLFSTNSMAAREVEIEPVSTK
jgi:hypothetical protein